jgi:ribonucleoside-diphosphate reductase alpha chain
VAELLLHRGLTEAPSVEKVQDAVETVLIARGMADVAKAYILHRDRHAEAREAKRAFGVADDLKLSVNAIRVLEHRYLRKDEHSEIVETPGGMMNRVARAIAEAERAFGGEAPAVDHWTERFSEVMRRLEFLPNSPTLMNAGTPMGQLAACFVLPIEDSIEGIFGTLRNMTLIHQSGGGTGFSFSALRPRDDVVRSTGGVASGPVSFMTIFDRATDVIKQGGRRRGANMAVLSVRHPDVLEFTTAKIGGALQNFNLSVAVDDAFMEAVLSGGTYELVNPRTGAPAGTMKARDVFELITTTAWQTGDPGLIFIDEINRRNPTPQAGRIEATNPCGEQPLLPYEACNLGSVNVAATVADGEVDWAKLAGLVETGVRFLDNVVEASRHPIPEIGEHSHANRKVGLGVMGFADALAKLRIPYDSEAALEFADRLMGFVKEKAHAASAALAAERGPFPNWSGSLWEASGEPPLRNAALTTVAPTGTISIIAGVSSGIEPLFALSYFRNVLGGARLLEGNPLFEAEARRRGFYSKELVAEIARTGSARNVEAVPEDVRRLFVTAFDIAPSWHVRMQAAFQKHTDSAVSKTVNLPKKSTAADVRKIYLMAYRLKCKGITVYRYGSRGGQVLTFAEASAGAGPRPGSGEVPGTEDDDYLVYESEYAGGCDICQV